MSPEMKGFTPHTVELPGSGKKVNVLVYSWDWKDQPEADVIFKHIISFPHCKPAITDVSDHDGGDDFVWLFSSEELTQQEAEIAFDLLMEWEMLPEDEDDPQIP